MRWEEVDVSSRRRGGNRILVLLMRLLLLGGMIVKAVPVVEDRPRDGTSWFRCKDRRGCGRVHWQEVSTSRIGANAGCGTY